MAFYALFCFFLLLAGAAERSAALRPTHPLRPTLDRINEEFGPFVGIVMARPSEAEVLKASGDFVPRSDVPFLEFYGRKFHFGTIRGVDVVYVVSGKRRLNAATTVQTLLAEFNIRGIVHFGTAGSSDRAFLSFADVAVPKFVAYTGAWTWTRFGAEKQDELPQLNFGEYNIPANGENRLAGVEYDNEELYSEGKPVEQVFWLPVSSEWYNIARKLKVRLRRCVDQEHCMPKTPEVVWGLNASTSDIFVDNVAYRDFLFKQFGVSTVDQESSAVLQAAKATGEVPVIVFRGVSDLAGEGMAPMGLGKLPPINALKLVVEFIGAVGKAKNNAWNVLKLN